MKHPSFLWATALRFDYNSVVNINSAVSSRKPGPRFSLDRVRAVVLRGKPFHFCNFIHYTSTHSEPIKILHLIEIFFTCPSVCSRPTKASAATWSHNPLRCWSQESTKFNEVPRLDATWRRHSTYNGHFSPTNAIFSSFLCKVWFGPEFRRFARKPVPGRHRRSDKRCLKQFDHGNRFWTIF